VVVSHVVGNTVSHAVGSQSQSQASQSQEIRSRFSIQGPLTFRSISAFDSSIYREDYLRKAFRLKTLLPVRTALQCTHATEFSLVLILSYMEDHFPNQENRLVTHSTYTPSRYMRINGSMLEQINILTQSPNKQSVLSIVDKTYSAIGRRAMRERILRPITSPTELTSRWAQVQWATSLDSQLRDRVTRDLKGMYDIPRLHYKLAAGTATVADILHMFQSYSHTICLLENLEGTPLAAATTLASSIRAYRTSVQNLLSEQKAASTRDCGFLTDIAGPETAALAQRITEVREVWNKRWISFCGSIGLNFMDCELTIDDDGSYSFECPRASFSLLDSAIKNPNAKIKGISIEKKKSGPLLLSCKDLDVCVRDVCLLRLELRTSLRKESLIVYDTLWEEVRGFQDEWIRWLGTIDCTLALATVANTHGWVSPTIGDHLDIQGLRHPIIELSQTRLEYVKHRVKLGGHDGGGRGWLLYGVNASGKSSLMKATGIAVLLAQAGSFVPADSMVIKPYDSAFSRIWNHDNVWAGLSSFAVEVSELRDIIANSTESSLILGDELCSGTESLSATALVTGILEHLDAKKAHFIFATHLHDLQKVLKNVESLSIYHLRVLTSPTGKLIYDRTLQPGSGLPTYGLEVARAMGIPLDIIERAHEIRKILGKEVAVGDAHASSWNASIRRYECEICYRNIENELEVHHIEERRVGGGNHPRNLVVVCEKCHDDHHSGESVIGPLQQTSEGAERSVTSGVRRIAAPQWTEDEMETIKATVHTFKSRPPARILAALEEAGIRITGQQLKKFRQGL